MPLLFSKKPPSKNLHSFNAASSFGSFSNARISSGTGLASGAVSSQAAHLPRGESTTSSRRTLPSVNTLSSLGTVAKQKTRTSVDRLRLQSLKLTQFAKNPRLLVPVIKNFYQKWHLKHLIPLIFVMAYMLLGAVIFYWLEGQAEHERMVNRTQEYRREKNLFVKRIEEIVQDRAAKVVQQRKKFVEEALDHFHQQLRIYIEEREVQWTLTSAMYYAGTVFTTIGYGDLACLTVWGRIITVVYAIVGIPLMLITLNELGKFLYKSINELVAKFSNNFSRFFSAFKRKNKSGELEKTDDTKLHKISTSRSMSPATAHMFQYRKVSFKLQTEEELTLNLDASDDPDIKASSPSPSLEPQFPVISTKNPQFNRYTDIDIESANELSREQLQEEEGFEDDLGLLGKQEEQELMAPPRMPVLVALSCTLGWIFLCAALFKIWETEWSYAESCYFMFISLSTIGLGDVNVKRRDLMVVCFVFVIIGLSLVSMCINVIQSALEDLYRKLLMKILMDYQAKLAQGEDQKGAGVGMMRMWGNSRTAKYLMPMLSADTRLAVMHKIQEEAKETGLEIPPIFEDIDRKSGMPKILILSQENRDPEKQLALFDEMVRQNDACVDRMESTSAQPAAPASVVFYESDAQTNQIFSEDKTDQTTAVELSELGVQVEQMEVSDLAVQTVEVEFGEFGVQTEEALPKQVSLNLPDMLVVDEGIQTDLSPSLSEQETQTKLMDLSDAETMTFNSSFSSTEMQTEVVRTMDEQLQTHIIDVLESEVQTEQTLHPELLESESQTDEIDLTEEEKEKLSKITKARRRLRRAFQNNSSTDSAKRRMSYGDTPTMSRWAGDLPEEGEDELADLSESSYESLNWDPIDGLHAEKQKKVQDLKKMFDRNRPLRTSSKKKGKK